MCLFYLTSCYSVIYYQLSNSNLLNGTLYSYYQPTKVEIRIINSLSDGR